MITLGGTSHSHTSAALSAGGSYEGPFVLKKGTDHPSTRTATWQAAVHMGIIIRKHNLCLRAQPHVIAYLVRNPHIPLFSPEIRERLMVLHTPNNTG